MPSQILCHFWRVVAWWRANLLIWSFFADESVDSDLAFSRSASTPSQTTLAIPLSFCRFAIWIWSSSVFISASDIVACTFWTFDLAALSSYSKDSLTLLDANIPICSTAGQRAFLKKIGQLLKFVQCHKYFSHYNPPHNYYLCSLAVENRRNSPRFPSQPSIPSLCFLETWAASSCFVLCKLQLIL